GFDDGHSLHQFTGGFFLDSRRPSLRHLSPAHPKPAVRRAHYHRAHEQDTTETPLPMLRMPPEIGMNVALFDRATSTDTTPTGVLFVAFRISYSPAIGEELIARTVLQPDASSQDVTSLT